MNLRHNIIANYLGQICVALIRLVMVPIYVRFVGAEAFGLVGFYAMLQAWFQLLDIGLSPTMARETARFGAGATDALSLRSLLRALEALFIGVGMTGAVVIMTGASLIANNWLKVQHLPIDEVRHSVMLMAVIVALRWVCGLYRGIINGFERLLWLNAFNVTMAAARFILVIPVFIYIGTSPTIFFAYEMLIAVIELIALVIQSYRLLPTIAGTQRLVREWLPLRNVLKFSLTIAFTGAVWVVVTNTDKLILSKLLPLTAYAYFTLAALVSSSVMLISGPISSALLPRLTRLNAIGDEVGLIRLYRNASQAVAVIAIPASLVIAAFPGKLLWAWTGDAEIALKAAPILTLYALGNGILALAAFPYYLQYAKGDLKMHLYGNAMFLIVILPTLIWATKSYGVVGAGYTWLGVNVCYFIFWVPKVHKRFVRDLHNKWLYQDLGPTVLATTVIVLGTRGILHWPVDRFQVGVEFALISGTSLVIAAASSSLVRDKFAVMRLLRHRRNQA